MADWLEAAKPLAADTVLNGALDGKDWQTAALAILALPASARLPMIVAEELGRIAFGRGVSDDRSERVVGSVVRVMEAGRV